MKVLIIPDVHLQDWIFRVADRIMETYKYDLVVILGDLVDSHIYGADLDAYKKTMEAAAWFAKKYRGRVVWLYGNHEIAYIDEQNCLCSGHNPNATQIVNEGLKRIRDNLIYDITVAERIDGVLFSHAGISDIYNVHCLETDKDCWRGWNEIIDRINNTRYSVLWTPQSPLWYRPNYIFLPLNYGNCLQIAGHTPSKYPYFFHNLVLVDTFYLGGANLFCAVDTETYEITYIDRELNIVCDDAAMP